MLFRLAINPPETPLLPNALPAALRDRQCDRNTYSHPHTQVWSPGLPITRSYSQLCLPSSVLVVQSRSAESPGRIITLSSGMFGVASAISYHPHLTLTWAVQQQHSKQGCQSSWGTACPSPLIMCQPRNGSRKGHFFPFPGLVSCCQPSWGVDVGSRFTCHRQDTGKVYKGLILPAARAKIAGETPEVETQTLLRTSVYSQPSREPPVYLWSLQEQIGSQL